MTKILPLLTAGYSFSCLSSNDSFVQRSRTGNSFDKLLCDIILTLGKQLKRHFKVLISQFLSVAAILFGTGWKKW